MARTFPPNNLPGDSPKWGRQIQDTILELEKTADSLAQTGNNSSRGSSGELAVLSRQIESTSSLLARLEAVGKVSSAKKVGDYEFPSDAQFPDPRMWYPSPPSVTVTSASGRFKVTVMAAASGGGAATFSAPGYNRDRIIGHTDESAYWGAILNSGWSLGSPYNSGASIGSWNVTYPPGSEITFTAQVLIPVRYLTVRGVEIQVQPLL